MTFSPEMVMYTAIPVIFILKLFMDVGIGVIFDAMLGRRVERVYIFENLGGVVSKKNGKIEGYDNKIVLVRFGNDYVSCPLDAREFFEERVYFGLIPLRRRMWKVSEGEIVAGYANDTGISRETFSEFAKSGLLPKAVKTLKGNILEGQGLTLIGLLILGVIAWFTYQNTETLGEIYRAVMANVAG